jgi:hypothetical protein
MTMSAVAALFLTGAAPIVRRIPESTGHGDQDRG